MDALMSGSPTAAGSYEAPALRAGASPSLPTDRLSAVTVSRTRDREREVLPGGAPKGQKGFAR